jgi:microcystin-dependent protein
MTPFLGEIRLFGGNFAPQGWNFCDGSLLPISQYDTLYALIGTTYGGDGQTNFALPDLRGRVPLHRGQDTGSNYTIGEVGGAESVTLTVLNVLPHTHLFAGSTVAGNVSSPQNAVLAAAPAGNLLYVQATGSTALDGREIMPAGGAQPHENRQPYQALNYIIALDGIWPSQ